MPKAKERGYPEHRYLSYIFAPAVQCSPMQNVLLPTDGGFSPLPLSFIDTRPLILGDLSSLIIPSH
jgi:hypothetical protein